MGWIVQLFTDFGEYKENEICSVLPNLYEELEKRLKQDPDYEEGDDFDGEFDYELSVVVAGTHGTQSWGWPGKDKVIIAHGGLNGACYPETILAFLYETAATLRDKLNGQDQ